MPELTPPGAVISTNSQLHERQEYGSAEGSAQPARPPEKQLRRDIMVIVIVLIAMYAAVNIIAIAILNIALMLSPEFQSAMLSGAAGAQAFLEGPQLNQLAAELTRKHQGAMLVVTGLVTLPLILIIRGRMAFTHDLVAVNQKPRPASIIKIFTLMLGVGFLVSLIPLALDPLLENMGFSLREFMDQGIMAIIASPIGILYVVVIGPIIEEMIFRGAILNRLARHGANFAIIVSALLFGLYHGILFQSFSAFFGGIIFGYVALRYSLKWAMLLHILNNAISVGMYLLENANIGTADILSLSFAGIFIIASVVIIIMKRGKISAVRQAGLPVTPRPYHVAFSSPSLIVYIVLFTALGVVTMVLPGTLAG